MWIVLVGVGLLGGFVLGRAVRASQYNGANIRGYIDSYAQPYHHPSTQYAQ